jgi:polar amino acid transport system substrate-binding protein
MLRRYAALAVLFFLSAIGAAHAQNASIWDQLREKGVLRVGLIPNRPPYQWENAGKLTGMSIKLAQDLATALEPEIGRPIRVENVTTSWSTLILDMQANRLDAFFGLTDTEERRRAIDMFGPLYAVPVVAIVRGNASFGDNWSDLNKPGVTVSVTMGTSDEEQARRALPKAKINALKSGPDAILDMLSGNSQAFITPILIGAPLMQKNPVLNRMIILQPPYALPSGGASRRDGDGKFAAFAQHWAAAYRASGAAKRTILDAMQETGFDLTKISGGADF